jgi:hypothetical protein
MGRLDMCKTKLCTVLLLLPCCAFAGFEADRPPLGSGDELGDSEDVSDAATASASRAPAELTASVEGLRVQLAPVVTTESIDGATRWRIDGRSSVDLASVASWVPDDAYGEASLTGPRTFSVELRDLSEQNTMASGLPLFLTMTEASGAKAEAAIWFRPRLSAGAGSRRIRFYATVRPVWLGGDIVYRGRLAVDPGWSASILNTPAPQQVPLEGGKLRLDWAFEPLAATLRQDLGVVRARAQHGAQVVERAAALEVRAVRLGLTRLDPREVWPTLCKPVVCACLAALPVGEPDTEGCGSYREVLACGGPEGARASRCAVPPA